MVVLLDHPRRRTAPARIAPGDVLFNCPRFRVRIGWFVALVIERMRS
jgi:hypothetical protein